MRIGQSVRDTLTGKPGRVESVRPGGTLLLVHFEREEAWPSLVHSWQVEMVAGRTVSPP